MTKEEVFKDMYEKEISGGCFDVKIDGISLYQFIKRGVRTWIMHCRGYEIGYKLPTASKWKRRKNIFRSLLQLIIVLISRKKYDNFIYSFSRTEKVNGKYVEKFTDPLIDYSNIGKSYIIFEPDFCGEHRRPRLHSGKIVYADSIAWLAKLIAQYKLRKRDDLFLSKWEELKQTIESSFPETDLSKTNYKRYVVEGYYVTKIYQLIFKYLGIKNFISPTRPAHLFLIPAAKKENVKVFELQHGLCYDLTNRTYGGYMDPMFTPDYFLSFGEIQNAIFYGIDEKNVVNIGWAFKKYLDKIAKKRDSGRDVLVISDGVLQDFQKKLLDAILLLAKLNRDVKFSYRPHPEEILSHQQIEQIKTNPNISINDKSENLFVTLASFTYVIGTNSSGMYDALDMKKKVGKLAMCGLTPFYSQLEDKNYFYEISNNESFVSFMNSPINEKPLREHYSMFNSKLLNDLIV